MKVLLVAGGTGGHIMPALAFGRYLTEKGVSVRYICGSRPLEIDIYKYHGVDPVVLPMEGSPAGVKKWSQRVKRSIDIVKSFFCLNSAVKSFSPDVCLLFGGYISFPALILCRIKGIKTIIHEQNCVAGKVTRLASKMGILVASGWRKCKGVSGAIPVGIPVRKLNIVSRNIAAEKIEVPSKGDRLSRYVLVTGGSLGSSSLNRSVIAVASMIEFTGLEFLIVGESGNLDFPSNVHFLKPQWDISDFISIADVSICRGGGSTLAEMKAYGIPTVVCPWSKAADGHQGVNAHFFAEEYPPGREIWNEDQSVDLLAEKLLKLLSISPMEMKLVSTAIEKSVSTLWRLILSHI